MIELKHVLKYYGNSKNRFQALKNIDLNIRDGDFTIILGASGSGKSTLLNVMSGLERADEGDVLYDGENISVYSDEEMTRFRRKNTGFVFQQYYLLPDMNVDKNVRMGADLASNKNYKEIINVLGLGDKLHKYPGELSGGEQQRVSVARALAKKPKYLFLDEPTGALDEECGRSLLNYISKLQADLSFNMVMVTHNHGISEMANTVVKMNSGRIIDIYKNKIRKTAYEIGW